MSKQSFISLFILAASVFGGGNGIEAKETIIIEPLFEYPTAPEEMDGLTERTNYLMDHFWDNFDFNRQSTVDQNALNDAFSVYSTAIPYAEKDKVLKSIDKLLKNIKGNSTMLMQFTKSAEESFYGPRASFWSDEAYLPFLNAIITDKNISDIRKERYKLQRDVIRRCTPGVKFPVIPLTLQNGRRVDFKPESALTLIQFGNPDCDDCKFAKTRLAVAADINELIDSGELSMVYIVADAIPEDQQDLLEQLSAYPDNWTRGLCYGGDDIFDIRISPSFYILDKDGKIVNKNLTVDTAIDYIRRKMAEK